MKRTRKKILSILITLCIIWGALPQTAFAADETFSTRADSETTALEPLEDNVKTQASALDTLLENIDGNPVPAAIYTGNCGASGNNLQWSMDTDTGVLTITGTGAMANYSSGSTPWNSYKGDIKTVVLPAGITIIGSSAFDSCSNLTNVNFPTSLTHINTNSFHGTKIGSLDLSNNTSLVSIGAFAFRYCRSLTTVKLPDQLTTIEQYTFSNCSSLTTLKLPANLATIRNDAFAYLPITEVEFPATLTVLEGNSFRDTSLRTIIFAGMNAPTSANAFSNVPGNGTVYYPVGATGYVKGTFGAPRLDSWTFVQGMPGAVLTLTGTNTRSSDSNAAAGFTSTKAGTYYYLAQDAGQSAPTAEQVKANGVFGGSCTANTPQTASMTSLVRGPQDVYIVVDAPGLALSNVLTVSFGKWNPSGNCGTPVATDMQWELDRESGVLTFTGSGAMRDFFRNTINDRPWAAYVNDIQSVSLPSGITTIGNSAFYGCDNLVIVNFPLSLTSIGAEAFYGTKITALDLSNHTALLSIGNNAFQNCNALTNVKLPDQLTTIAANIFRSCGSLTDVQLPQNTDTIGGNAFDSCGNLANINFPLSLTSIGGGAFYGTKITTLDLSNHTSLSIIGAYAFRYCGSLTNIKLPDQLAIIEQYTFSNCSAVTELKLPANLVTIKNDAFGYLSITKVEFPATLTTLEGNAFRNTNLNTIVFNGMSAPTPTGVRSFADVPDHGTLYYPAGATGYVKGTFGTPDLDSWTFYDMNAPVLTGNTVTRTSDSNATVSFTSTKAGTYYYLVQAAGDPAPAASAVVSTGLSGNCGMTSTSVNITSLVRGAWDVYLVVETPGSVLQSAVLKMEIYDRPAVADISPPTPVSAGQTLSLTAPAVTDNGAAVTDAGWEISADGNTGWTIFAPATTMTYAYNGQFLRYYATNIVGTGYSNSVLLTVNRLELTLSLSCSNILYRQTPNPQLTGNTGGGTVTYEYKVQGADDSSYANIEPTLTGDYTVRASVSATDIYNSGTATADFSINKAAAGITLAASPVAGALADGSVTLTASLTGVRATDYPTGNIVFKRDNTELETVSLVNGEATYTWNNVPFGTHNLTAEYTGDGNYVNAAGSILNYDVEKKTQDALTITGIPANPVYGDGSFTLGTTGGSGSGAVTYTLQNGDAVSVSGNTVTIEKAGTAVIKAVKAADNIYNETSMVITLTIGTHYRSYINGYPGGTFQPNANMTRAEAAMLFYNLLSDKTASGGKSFTDVKGTDWYGKAVITLTGKGILKGYPDGSFRSQGAITRAELAAMVLRFAGVNAGNETASFKDVSASHWAGTAIATASSKGYFNGYTDGTFHPNAKIIRAEVVTVMNRVLERPVDTTVLSKLKMPFSDVATSHWAYYQILEAAVSRK